jgi:hypothetical protein
MNRRERPGRTSHQASCGVLAEDSRRQPMRYAGRRSSQQRGRLPESLQPFNEQGNAIAPL